MSSVLQNKEWYWKPARSEELVDVESKLSQIQIKECDRAIWIVENKKRKSKQREEGENAERRGRETERRGREGRD